MDRGGRPADRGGADPEPTGKDGVGLTVAQVGQRQSGLVADVELRATASRAGCSALGAGRRASSALGWTRTCRKVGHNRSSWSGRVDLISRPSTSSFPHPTCRARPEPTSQVGEGSQLHHPLRRAGKPRLGDQLREPRRARSDPGARGTPGGRGSGVVNMTVGSSPMRTSFTPTSGTLGRR
jgi:hypothetical protein